MNSWAQRSIGSDGTPAINIATILSGRQGRYGYDIYSDTAAHAAPTDNTWCEIHAITAVVFASVTFATDPKSSGTLAGITLSAGQSLYVQATAITLTSGTVIMYRDR